MPNNDLAEESSFLMDEYGHAMLAELQADARISLAKLSQRIGLSASATAERMRRMEEAKIIRSYTIEIDPDALGQALQAWVRMTCDGAHYQSFLKFVKTLPEVRECHHVTGGDAFLLMVTTASMAELERTIERLLPYGIPTTSLVLSSPVLRRGYDIARTNLPEKARK